MMRLWMIAAMAPLAACGANASESAPTAAGSRSYALSDFTGVELKGSDDVIVTVGPAFAVRAEGPAAELDRLKIERDGSMLNIGREGGGSFNWGGDRDEGVKIYVSMPRIVRASVVGSGDMKVDRVTGGDFSAGVTGSGDLAIAALRAASTKLSVAGSGDIVANGSAETLSLSVAGSGDIDARGVKAPKGSVSIAGSGDVSAEINGPVEVSIMGSGNVQLGAGAKCTVNKMGSGDVRCG
jgi:hypothetical protein